MQNDAMRIKLRKRIIPNHFHKKNERVIDTFYPPHDGNKFFALGHFTDFFIDRVSDEFYMGKSTKDYPPKSNQKYSLQDLILPSSHRLGHQTNYEVQYLYLSYCVSHYINCVQVSNKQDKKEEHIENLVSKEFQCTMITGIKYVENINKIKVDIEIKLKKYLINYLKYKFSEENFAIEIRSSLGFGDYCIIVRAENFDILNSIYHTISKTILSNFSKAKARYKIDQGIKIQNKLLKISKNINSQKISRTEIVKKAIIKAQKCFEKPEVFNYDLLKYAYTIPGINKKHYDEFVEDWNQKQEKFKNSKDAKHKIVHLTTKHSSDLKYFFDNYSNDEVNFILGNYDFLIFDKLVPKDVLQNNYRTKTRLLLDHSENESYVQAYSEKNEKKIQKEFFWDEFWKIKEINDFIGTLDHKKVLTDIHILSLEHHINLFNRHNQEYSICNTLLEEWQSILNLFIEFTQIYLKKIKELKDTSTFRQRDFYLEYYSTINSLRTHFETGLRFINRSSRHWVVGSKSHIEFTGIDNVFHFGNTAKIYNIYTIILNEIQDIFTEMSCNCDYLFTEKREKINFFLVPDNCLRTSSAVLFPSLSPNSGRLITVNLSTEVIFNFQMIGLVMHEIGQYICHAREFRNELLLQIVLRTFSNNILIYLLNNNENTFTTDQLRGEFTILESDFYNQFKKTVQDQITTYLSAIFYQIMDNQIVHENDFHLFSSPMLDFSKYIKSIFPNKKNVYKDKLLTNYDYVLEDSPFQHDLIDLPEDFWELVISREKETPLFNTTKEPIIKTINTYSDENLSDDLMDIIKKFPEEVKRLQSRYYLEIKFFSERKDLLTKSEIYPSIDHNELEDVSTFNDFFQISVPEEDMFNHYFIKHYYWKKKLFDAISVKNKISDPKKITQKFNQLTKDVRDFIDTNQNHSDFSDFSIEQNDIKFYPNLDFIDYDIDQFTELIVKHIDLASDANQNLMLLQRIFEYYLNVYYLSYEELCSQINRVINYLDKIFWKTHINSGTKEEKNILKNNLTEVFYSQSKFIKNENGFMLDSLVETIQNNNELIKEIKADYFMIRVLQMSEEQYLKQFEFNSDPDMECDDFEKQKEKRKELLKKASSFIVNPAPIDYNFSREDMFEMDIEELIVYMIRYSVDPVLDEFKNNQILTLCQKIFNEEFPGISDDLKFISKILDTKNGTK